MKTPIYVILLLAFVLSGCSKDLVDNDISNNDITTIDLKFANAAEQTRGVTQNLNIPMDATVCFRTQLLDSKLQTVGYADFEIIDKEVVISFKTDLNWDIQQTYLNVKDCTSSDFPLDENGDPVMDEFKYSSFHENPVKRVDHIIDSYELTTSMCFAAFATLVDKYGKSVDVWAHGWEMYTPAYQKSCLPKDNNDNTEDCIELSDIEFYIPLQESASGVFPHSGSNPDSVTLNNLTPTSEGYVDMNLNFSGLPLIFKDAVLSISFHDLDLHTDIIETNGRILSFAESFTLRNAQGDILAVLDASHPRDGEFTWTFDLPDNIFHGSELTLTATFTANLELLEGNQIQVTNTAEELFEVTICGNGFTGTSLQ